MAIQAIRRDQHSMVAALVAMISRIQTKIRVPYGQMSTSEEARRALGTAILVRRTRLRLSQADLGKATGLNPANLSRIEAGAADMTVTTQCRVAAGLGINVFQLWAEAEREAVELAKHPDRDGGSP